MLSWGRWVVNELGGCLRQASIYKVAVNWRAATAKSETFEKAETGDNLVKWASNLLKGKMKFATRGESVRITKTKTHILANRLHTQRIARLARCSWRTVPNASTLFPDPSECLCTPSTVQFVPSLYREHGCQYSARWSLHWLYQFLLFTEFQPRNCAVELSIFLCSQCSKLFDLEIRETRPHRPVCVTCMCVCVSTALHIGGRKSQWASSKRTTPVDVLS